MMEDQFNNQIPDPVEPVTTPQPSFEAEPPRHVNPYDPSFTAKTGETYTPPQPSFDARDGRWNTQNQSAYDPSGDWTPSAQPSFDAQGNRWEKPQYGQTQRSFEQSQGQYSQQPSFEAQYGQTQQHGQNPQYGQPQQYGQNQQYGQQYGRPQNFPAQNYDMGTQTDANLDKLGRRAFMLGIASLITWVLPILGYATSLIGLNAARKGINSPNYAAKAKTGRIFCLVGLGLSLLNSIIGIINQMGR